MHSSGSNLIGAMTTAVGPGSRRLTAWMIKGILHHPSGQRGPRGVRRSAAAIRIARRGLAVVVNARVAAHHHRTSEGAMDVMLSILIGLPAGLAVAALAP